MRYPSSFTAFREIVFVDTEYHAPSGHLPELICLVASHLRAKRTTRMWLWKKRAPAPLPVLYAADTLVVAYTAAAELIAFRQLGWPFPSYVLDLNVEVRNLTNGKTERPFISLYESARKYDIPYLNKSYKDHMRDIAIRGNSQEILANRQAMIAYCEDDVRVLVPLLRRICPRLSLPHALVRGEYVKASASIEYQGVPIDQLALQLLLDRRQELRHKIADQFNQQVFPLFDGDSLRDKGFGQFVRATGLLPQWPRSPTGKLRKDTEDTLDRMRYAHPSINELRQTIKALNELKHANPAIGTDGRNRYMGGLFGTITGRNNPRSKETIWHRSRWWRHLVRPDPRMALGHLDYSAEEFFVTAVLAEDAQGIADYVGGDVYTTWGRTIGLIPPGSEAKVPGPTRDMLKVAVLAIIYGMKARTLSQELGLSLTTASQLLQSFRERYRGIGTFVERTIQQGGTFHVLRTRLDWRLHVGELIRGKSELGGRQKPGNVLTINSLRDWPAQSNAAEILRLAVVRINRLGIRIVATLHDSITIEAPIESIEETVDLARREMEAASAMLLYSRDRRTRYRLRVDAKIIRYPDRYREPGAQEWWQYLCDLVKEITGEDLENVRSPTDEFVANAGIERV